MLQEIPSRLVSGSRVPSVVKLIMVLAILALAAQAFAQVPTYTGCYSATSGTINKLAKGFSPAKACNTGDVQVSFSAGDITKISVTGGLSGGGDNGDITISLDPKYSLPQSCAANQVAKWTGSAWQCANDENTTYTNGTGLDLNSGQFSVNSGYQLPQGCSNGQVPKANGGSWSCASTGKGAHAYAANNESGTGLDNQAVTTVLTLTVPSGLYLVYGTATLINYDSDSQEGRCQLKVDGSAVDGMTSRFGGYVQADSGIAYTMKIPLMSWGTVTQTITITCDTYHGYAYARVAAVALDALN